MKLRWFVEINQYGQRTEPELQFLDDWDDSNEWECVSTEEVKIESNAPWKGGDKR